MVKENKKLELFKKYSKFIFNEILLKFQKFIEEELIDFLLNISNSMKEKLNSKKFIQKEKDFKKKKNEKFKLEIGKIIQENNELKKVIEKNNNELEKVIEKNNINNSFEKVD
jgi:nitrogenase subunit NifH